MCLDQHDYDFFKEFFVDADGAENGCCVGCVVVIFIAVLIWFTSGWSP